MRLLFGKAHSSQHSPGLSNLKYVFHISRKAGLAVSCGCSTSYHLVQIASKTYNLLYSAAQCNASKMPHTIAGHLIFCASYDTGNRIISAQHHPGWSRTGSFVQRPPPPAFTAFSTASFFFPSPCFNCIFSKYRYNNDDKTNYGGNPHGHPRRPPAAENQNHL